MVLFVSDELCVLIEGEKNGVERTAAFRVKNIKVSYVVKETIWYIKDKYI